MNHDLTPMTALQERYDCTIHHANTSVGKINISPGSTLWDPTLTDEVDSLRKVYLNQMTGDPVKNKSNYTFHVFLLPGNRRWSVGTYPWIMKVLT